MLLILRTMCFKNKLKYSIESFDSILFDEFIDNIKYKNKINYNIDSFESIPFDEFIKNFN